MQMLNFTNNCYLKEENKIHMTKNAIFWIREDFRIEYNPALSFASQNHDNVIGLFIYNKADFDKKREAQKWWLYKSLEEFKSELSKYKVNLQILEGDELDVLSKIKKKDDISVYWNKIYEPDVIAKGKKIRDAFLKNEIEWRFTGKDLLLNKLIVLLNSGEKTFALRKQDQLNKEQALYLARCKSKPRDISLYF